MPTKSLIPLEKIEKTIFLIRKQKVILDSDLAELYRVETGGLVRAMKRNKDRFPADFMFQLTQAEFANLRCQRLTQQARRAGQYRDNACLRPSPPITLHSCRLGSQTKHLGTKIRSPIQDCLWRYSWANDPAGAKTAKNWFLKGCLA